MAGTFLDRVVSSAQDTLENKGGRYVEVVSDVIQIEAQKKSRKLTDQSKASDNKNSIDDIVPPGTDLDNNQVIDNRTGETIRDLDYKGEI